MNRLSTEFLFEEDSSYQRFAKALKRELMHVAPELNNERETCDTLCHEIDFLYKKQVTETLNAMQGKIDQYISEKVESKVQTAIQSHLQEQAKLSQNKYSEIEKKLGNQVQTVSSRLYRLENPLGNKGDYQKMYDDIKDIGRQVGIVEKKFINNETVLEKRVHSMETQIDEDKQAVMAVRGDVTKLIKYARTERQEISKLVNAVFINGTADGDEQQYLRNLILCTIENQLFRVDTAEDESVLAQLQSQVNQVSLTEPVSKLDELAKNIQIMGANVRDLFNSHEDTKYKCNLMENNIHIYKGNNAEITEPSYLDGNEGYIYITDKASYW